MDFVYLGTCFHFIASIISIESLTFTTENFHGGKWIIKNGKTENLICRNYLYTGKMSLVYEKQRVAECSLNSCETYFTDYGAFNIKFDLKKGEIQLKINSVTMEYDGKLFQCSDGTETLRLSPVVQEPLTFTTEKFQGGKWIIKNGKTENLICRKYPYTGKMSLIYEKQRVAECSLNSCKTYFTDYGAFNIQFDLKKGEIQWKINPVTMEYDGKLFKCSDGTETLRLSPVVKESLTFTTENVHGGKWIIKDRATDMLICRSNPYMGKIVLEYEKQRVAECSQNSCKTYFTDNGAFKILSNIMNGVLKWKIGQITMKYNGKVFKCSNGLETLSLSPIVEDSDNLTPRTVIHLCIFVLVLALFIFAILSHCSSGQPTITPEKREQLSDTNDTCNSFDRMEQLSDTDDNSLDRTKQLSDTDDNSLDRMKQLSDTDDNSLDRTKQLSDTDDNSLDRTNQLSDTDDNSFDRMEQLSDTDDSTIVTPKAGEKCKLSWKPISYIITRENKIMKEDLTFVKIIGKGAFGEVWKGVWRRSGKDKNVALKTVNREQIGVHIEVELMQGMDHENIVQFYGTCIQDDKTTIVMELIENGSLLKYLHYERGNLETPAFVDIASQIVKGLIYLESQKIIHRDLAARNILVSSFREGKTIKTVKIADFGLARRLTNENFEYIPMQFKEPFPFNGWTAPEALEHHKFTFKSDVWSFGILLMEMVMFGERPYAGMADEDILPYVKESPENRMKCPKHCNPELYQIMQMCWKLDSAERPTFKELKEKLDKIS